MAPGDYQRRRLIECITAEHYPALHEFGLVRVGERMLLVNRTRAGETQVFDDLVFHTG